MRWDGRCWRPAVSDWIGDDAATLHAPECFPGSGEAIATSDMSLGAGTTTDDAIAPARFVTRGNGLIAAAHLELFRRRASIEGVSRDGG